MSQTGAFLDNTKIKEGFRLTGFCYYSCYNYSGTDLQQSWVINKFMQMCRGLQERVRKLT